MMRRSIFILVIAACSARSTPSDVHIVAPARAAPVEQSSAKAPLNSSETAASVHAAPPRAPETVPGIARSELVDIFVTPDVLSLGPESATMRFAHAIPLVRTFDTVDGLVLAGKTAREDLSFSYVPDGKGNYLCQVATLEFIVGSVEQSAEVRREVDLQLRKMLGKPKFYPSSSTPYWRLVDRVEASLSERTAPGRYLVSIQIAEPDGP